MNIKLNVSLSSVVPCASTLLDFRQVERVESTTIQIHTVDHPIRPSESPMCHDLCVKHRISTTLASNKSSRLSRAWAEYDVLSVVSRAVLGYAPLQSLGGEI